MARPSSLSDSDLLARLPALVHAERSASADVIAHLMELDRRRLYLGQACSSLYAYCIERLGYAEDAALRRVRIAHVAARVPRVLDELRTGAIHLTGLFLLSQHLTEANADALLDEARHRSKRELERLIAHWFPRPDVPERIVPAPQAPGVGADDNAGALPFGVAPSGPRVACPGQGYPPSHGRLEPLRGASPAAERPPRSGPSVPAGPPLASLARFARATRYRVEFTASGELHDKIERARELLSHSVPSGELSTVLERALDALIHQETKRRVGAGRPRKARSTRRGSRHVPVTVARQVWERDGAQCTFKDDQGRRCSERRFLTIEHRQPFALGGPPTVDNLCLLCNAHNQQTAREVFGEGAVSPRKSAERYATCETGHGATVAPPYEREAGPTREGSPVSSADSTREHDACGPEATAKPAVEPYRHGADAPCEHDPRVHDASAALVPDPRALEEQRKVLSALCHLGFPRRQAALAVDAAVARAIGPGLQPLLRAALEVLS